MTKTEMAAIVKWIRAQRKLTSWRAARREVREVAKAKGRTLGKDAEWREALEMIGVDFEAMWDGLFGSKAAMERDGEIVREIDEGTVSAIVETDERMLAAATGVESHRVIEWVAEHLDDEDVQRTDAPSGAAWSMLKWARSDDKSRETFWTRNYQSTVIPKRERTGGAGDRDVEEAELSRTLDRLDRIAKEAQA